ncbi:MAG: alpha/beta hydrolase [Gemmatimonadaceae bacterium]|nr:alpha/beta hydrolase [Gemmatimonadaceae bacterium]
MRRFIVLPGMHGTTELLDDFAAAAPRDVQVELVALPTERLGYSALASHFERTLRLTSDSVLIAESFSGPLAIMLAERCEVGALVLCNTFASAPYPGALRALPLSLLDRIPPPAAVVRHFIVGPHASDSLIGEVRAAVASVPAGLLGFRARGTLTVDVRPELARCTAPILYLRGTEDRLVRNRSVRAVIEAASQPVSVARIAGPHLLLKTAPSASWRAILEFLARTRAT